MPGAAQTGLNQSNARGQYAGFYADADGVVHGFVIRRGTVTTIDAPGAAATTAYDINDRGEIVGAGFPDLLGPTSADEHL